MVRSQCRSRYCLGFITHGKGAEDRVLRPDNLSGGHLDGKGDEVALHARGDVERSSGGVHAGSVLDVSHLLQCHLRLLQPFIQHWTHTLQPARLGILI